MLRDVATALLSLVLATTCGCGGTTPRPGGPDGGTGATDGGDGGLTTQTLPGLPCDVSAILQSNCTICHGTPLSGGAPFALTSYADLAAMSKQDPGQTVAQRVLARITDTTAPMPPFPAAPLSASDIATIQSWVSSGAPMGSCASGGPDPLNAAPICTSGQTDSAPQGSPLMHPGQACLSCHSTHVGMAPQFQLAGTVYPTGHEPNDCVGGPVQPSGGYASIQITDATGATTTLQANAYGNFFLSPLASSLPKPYTAMVLYEGRSRAMTSPQQSGDCNGCHTQDGANGAPGRITLP
jgi:mono/diheme cytochrome c family protein